MDFVENLLSFLLPFEIELLKIINFFKFVLFLEFVFFNLSAEDLEVNAALSQFFILFAVIALVGVVQSLEFLVELSTFDLIISNRLVGLSKFFLFIHDFLLARVNFMLQIPQLFLITLAIILK